jgi:hypothetical protein
MKLSAVVQLIDDFTGFPAVGCKPRFALNQQPFKPLVKEQAFYAFSDLDDGAYQLTIVAPQFLLQQASFQVPLQLPLAQAIVACHLVPGPLYPYPAGTTLIRGQVLQATNQQPLAGVTVSAGYQNWRGQEKTATTLSADFGQYNGRFALALNGKLGPATAVALSFSKAGYASVEKQLQMAPATMQFVDIEMR